LASEDDGVEFGGGFVPDCLMPVVSVFIETVFDFFIFDKMFVK